MKLRSLKFSFSEWFKTFRVRITANHGLTGIAFVLSFVFAGMFALQVVPLFNKLPDPELNLAGQWEVCVAENSEPTDCVWHPIQIPSDIPKSLLGGFKGWAIYKTRFTAPVSCKEGACAFFFEEIGDSAEARLNGHVIGRHGQFPPHASYAKHYPVSFQISRDSLRDGESTNELMIVAYSMKKTQAGVRSPPVGIYTGENAFKLTQSFTILNVVNPVLSFVALFMIVVLSMVSAGPVFAKDEKFWAFARYGLASACFLLSISEVPREYLPIGFAGYLHFTLRILHDWSFFELVACYFDYRPRFVNIFRPIYGLTLAAFLVQFFIFFLSGDNSAQFGRGFDVGFFTLRVVFPLLLLPHLMGMYSSFIRRKTWEGHLSLILFLASSLFQIHDSLIFHGFMSGIYFVKWYPLLVGVVFGLFFLERSRELRTKARVEQEQIKQMKNIYTAIVGLAHDLEQPFKGIEMALMELSRRPDNQDLIHKLATTFPNKLSRFYELNRAILSYSRELSTELEIKKESVALRAYLEDLVSEFKGMDLLSGIALEVECDQGLVANFDPAKMRRVFRNLIRNAAEACAGRTGSRIILAARKSGSGVEICVTDNGPGIPEHLQDRLFQPFESYGKVNGTGLGLATSKRIVEAHGGTILSATVPEGTAFGVSIP